MEQSLQAQRHKLIWKKDGTLEHSIQPWENKHGRLTVLLLPDFQLLWRLLPITQSCWWQATE